MKTKINLLIVIVIIVSSSIFCNEGLFNYKDQSKWGGECGPNETENSPINIIEPTILSWDGFKEAVESIKNFFLNEKPQYYIKDMTHSPLTGVTYAANPEKTGFYFTPKDGLAGNTVTLVKKSDEFTFGLIGVHIHCPSEHTLKTFRNDCELHMVHLRQGVDENTVADKRKYLVVSFLISKHEGENHPLFEGEIMDFSPYLNEEAKFYFYEGGLTTPACSQQVNWVIKTEPLKISQKQFEAIFIPINEVFSGAFGNARNVQSLNSRTVFEISFDSSKLLSLSMLLIVLIMLMV